MNRTRKSLLYCGLAFFALSAGRVSSLEGQVVERHAWKLTASFTGLRTGATAGWVYGPELGIRGDFGEHWGLGLRVALPVLDTESYSDDGAAAIDLGPTLTFSTAKSELGLAAGATGFLVADRGELIDGGIGAFIAGHATRWLNTRMGLTAGGTVRTSGGGTYPSVSLGISYRF